MDIIKFQSEHLWKAKNDIFRNPIVLYLSWINIFGLNNCVLFTWLSLCIFTVFKKVKSGVFSKQTGFLFVAVFPLRDLKSGGTLAAPAQTREKLEKNISTIKMFFFVLNKKDLTWNQNRFDKNRFNLRPAGRKQFSHKMFFVVNKKVFMLPTAINAAHCHKQLFHLPPVFDSKD